MIPVIFLIIAQAMESQPSTPLSHKSLGPSSITFFHRRRQRPQILQDRHWWHSFWPLCRHSPLPLWKMHPKRYRSNSLSVSLVRIGHNLLQSLPASLLQSTFLLHDEHESYICHAEFHQRLRGGKLLQVSIVKCVRWDGQQDKGQWWEIFEGVIFAEW